MLPSRRLHRGRIALAVAISLALHGALVMGWLTVRPVGGQAGEDFPTQVDSPDDHELTITLREPRDARPPEPKGPDAPPAALPPSVRGPDTPANMDPLRPVGHSLDPGSAEPKRQPTRPLHGKLKAGKTVVYVIDSSSSMGSDGLLQKACRAVRDSLDLLNPESRFQIVAYNSGVTSLFEQPMSGTSANVARAACWLEKLVAEGSSDHRVGLREAVSAQPDAIFLLTDADDLDEREVRAIRPLLRKPIYLSVAIFGSRTATEGTPLERLTNDLGGRVSYVER